jgi:hypothetical protein
MMWKDWPGRVQRGLEVLHDVEPQVEVLHDVEPQAPSPINLSIPPLNCLYMVSQRGMELIAQGNPGTHACVCGVLNTTAMTWATASIV